MSLCSAPQIKDVKAGWRAIHDMAVRGAPAIAISAALSLATDLIRSGSGSQFSSAAEASEAIKGKLDFLVTRCAGRLVDGAAVRCIQGNVYTHTHLHSAKPPEHNQGASRVAQGLQSLHLSVGALNPEI